MILVKTNINEVVQVIITKLHDIAEADKALRDAANGVLSEMKVRIHKNGFAADGQPIGTYSKGYMVIRSGGFQNAKRVTRGVNKGKLKDAGVFTDRVIRLNKNTGVFTEEDKVGKVRLHYNRGADPKVILSLTRQMEKDMKVTATSAGYWIGFTNPLNTEKSFWVEKTYKKDIYSLTEKEIEIALEIFNKHVEDALNK